jgi:hypothetical protein
MLLGHASQLTLLGTHRPFYSIGRTHLRVFYGNVLLPNPRYAVTRPHKTDSRCQLTNSLVISSMLKEVFFWGFRVSTLTKYAAKRSFGLFAFVFLFSLIVFSKKLFLPGILFIEEKRNEFREENLWQRTYGNYPKNSLAYYFR